MGRLFIGCEKEPLVEAIKCNYNRNKVAAIPGYNIKTLEGTTVEQCQRDCSDKKECKALEFATTRDAGGGQPAFYGAGTCLLQSTADGMTTPSVRYKNLDLYIKSDCKIVGAAISSVADIADSLGQAPTTATKAAEITCQYSKTQNQAIPGYNIKTFKGTSEDECQAICSKDEECKAIEYATSRAAGGSATVYSAGTCLLQSKAEGGVTPGPGYKNLDLHTKYGCVTSTSTASGDVDCSKEYNDWPGQWVKSWSDAKKAYCCKTANRGCANQVP